MSESVNQKGILLA